MKTRFIICSLVAMGCLASLTPGCATSHAQLEAQAKISKAEAGKIALAKVPGGTIKESELEKEKGRLIWSFDIATPGAKDITEIQVDALSGQIVAVEKETPAQQEKEKRAQEREGKAK